MLPIKRFALCAARQNMKKKKKYLHIIIFTAAISFLIFNDLGLIKLISIYSQREAIKEEIDILIAQENQLIKEITLLETDENYIKKIAREEFYMAKPGEKIYRVKRDKFID